MIAHVALPTPLYRLFDYIVPTALSQSIVTGVRVRVPFGRKQLLGVVVSVDQSSELPLAKLKSLSEVLDSESVFTEAQWALLQWSAEYYHYPLGEVLSQALPMHLRQGKSAQKEQETYWSLSTHGGQIESEILKRAPKQWSALQQLRELQALHPEGKQFAEVELQALGVNKPILAALAKKGLVTSQLSDKFSPSASTAIAGPVLNDEQQVAVDTVMQDANIFKVYLLNGVTGSGKTEVYLEVLKKVLVPGAQTLVLVPEIGLTAQTVNRFRQRLVGKVAVLHSGLSDKERLATWIAAKNGELSVLIGTRSAVFTPFKNLCAIIVDESHDVSFKQWDGFKYHARDVAVRRAQLENIPIILGSATPSLTSLYNVRQGKYHELRLQKRAGGAQQPQLTLVDMRKQPLQEGIASSVLQAIEQHLQRGNQVLVFLNRRGYAPVILCHHCGWTPECERCQTPLTLHQSPAQLQCHHCGKVKRQPQQCGACGDTQLLAVGLGTERVETLLQQKFPTTNILRIDRDSTRRKNTLKDKLDSVHRGEAQLLIGTQMIAKGHHFPNVTLVVVLDVDGGLYSVDYAASERMAQLILQVAGRAGRAEKVGEVLLQTHQPQHPLLQTLTQQGYNAFASVALTERQATLLPPYQHLVLVSAEAVASADAANFLKAVQTILKALSHGATLLGPLASPIEKRAGRFRWQLLISHQRRGILHTLVKQALPAITKNKTARKVRWSIDVDPLDIL